ncbi:hypothetical protein [Streptomyces virginiae]|uniref:hypothetical protein n=1 Tax=Streptomyces virginiae TaxID=1961 RepID=UPI00365BABBE
MARRRRPEAPPADDSAPDWLWGFTAGSFFMKPRGEEEEDVIDAFITARRKWREARDAWLQERGLVVYGMRGLSWQEYKRIEREEPHRILRRHEGEKGQDGRRD